METNLHATIVSTTLMTAQLGNEWLLLNREFYAYGIVLLLVYGYAASNLPRELYWFRPLAQLLTHG